MSRRRARSKNSACDLPTQGLITDVLSHPACPTQRSTTLPPLPEQTIFGSPDGPPAPPLWQQTRPPPFLPPEQKAFTSSDSRGEARKTLQRRTGSPAARMPRLSVFLQNELKALIPLWCCRSVCNFCFNRLERAHNRCHCLKSRVKASGFRQRDFLGKCTPFRHK